MNEPFLHIPPSFNAVPNIHPSAMVAIDPGGIREAHVLPHPQWAV